MTVEQLNARYGAPGRIVFREGFAGYPDVVIANKYGAATDRPGLQVNMNGDFISVHCLQPGTYDFILPFDCRVTNLRSGRAEDVANGRMKLVLTAGETCRFALSRLVVE